MWRDRIGKQSRREGTSGEERVERKREQRGGEERTGEKGGWRGEDGEDWRLEERRGE